MPESNHSLFLFLIIPFLFLGNYLQAQETNPFFFDRFSIGTGINHSYRNHIEGSRKHQTQFGALELENKWSAAWPMDGEAETSDMQNFCRKFDFYFLMEKNLNQNAFSILTGIESGGRTFRITDKFDSNVLPVTTVLRNYHVLSVPVMLRQNVLESPKCYVMAGAGLSAHFATSATARDEYYSITRQKQAYATLNLEGEINSIGLKRGSLSFFARYEFGFFNILDDQITALSNAYKPRHQPNSDFLKTLHHYPVQSTGSCLKIGVRCNFNFSKRLTKNTEPWRLHFPEKVEDTAPDPKEDLRKRPLAEAEEFVVDTDRVEVCVVDDQTLDGDSITIEVNGEFVVEDYGLRKSPRCFELRLDEAAPSNIVFHALNEGRIKPNTLKVTFRTGDTSTDFYLKNDLTKSSVIKVIYRPKE